MDFSMRAMKNLEIPLGQEVITFSEPTQKYLREARDLYVRAFKRGDEAAMPAFFDCSETCVRTVGEHRILEAAFKVDNHLQDVFPKGCSLWGVQYLRRFLA